MEKKIIVVRNAAPIAETRQNKNRDTINPDEYRVVHGGVDSTLLFTVLILVAFGLVMVFSASYADAASRYGDSYYYIKRQSVMVVIGRFPRMQLRCFFLLRYWSWVIREAAHNAGSTLELYAFNRLRLLNLH